MLKPVVAPVAPVAHRSSSRVRVPSAIVASAIDSVGRYFEQLCGIDHEVLGRDHVDPERYRRNIEALDREAPLAGRKVLEIGCGFGVGLAVITKEFGADAYGVEPDSEGFNASFTCARRVLEANDLDPTRVVDAIGEQLPFPDASFDVVYSNNVLEHTSDPARVLEEACRVLKPGGRLYVEMPNFLSYYEGHYLVLQPPIVWNGQLSLWVEHVCRRDPAFARTLRTEINPVWLRRTLRQVGRRFPVSVQTLGEDRFLQRLVRPFAYQTTAVESKTGSLIRILQRVNRFNWIGRLMVALQAHYPIVLIATRSRDRSC